MEKIAKIKQRSVFKEVCKPDWCYISKHPIIVEKMICASASVYNLQNTMINKAINFQKLGLEDKVNSIYNFLNRVNHTVFYLCLLFSQVYLNEESYSDYITCEELKCIRDNFLCEGFDIECIYECFDICNYTKVCTQC